MISSVTKSYKTSAGTDVIDITHDAADFVAETGIREGVLTLSVPGSTASITTIEYEPGVVQDLIDVLDKIAPAGRSYKHDAAWGDGNGYSHVRAALMKPSLSIPVIGEKLALGTWQQIVLCDFDNKSRSRKVVMQVIGDEA